MVEKLRAAILGATGIVGQRFISLLYRHPWFEVSSIYSARHAGERYGDVVKWVVGGELPGEMAEARLERGDPDSVVSDKPDIVFSALPSDAAKDVEPELAKRGLIVVSNSSPFRMERDIPLLIPEINADHVELSRLQERRGWKGRIYKVPNCTTIILAITLKPLLDEYGIEKVIVSSMQSLSGAGLTGVPSMLILDNLIPFIEGEEEKVESETLKILGSLVDGAIKPAPLKVSASTHRVMVLEGHTIAVFAKTRSTVEPEDAARVLEDFKGNKIKELNLPSAPRRVIVVRRERDRPQPRLDRMEGNGMSVVVGRIRKDEALGGVKYVALGHNTIRGAAGNAVLIAELLRAWSMI